MRKNKPVILFLALIALTSCSRDLYGVMDGSVYHSSDFADNMYEDHVLSSSLGDSHVRQDTSSAHAVGASLKTAVGGMRPSDREATQTNEEFAQKHKLSKKMPDVRWGYESKLFDGILFCSDAVRTSKSRLQLYPSGFGYQLPETISHVSFIGLYLKAGADTSSGGKHIKDLTVDVSLYTTIPLSSLYNRITFSLDIAGLTASSYPGFYGFYMLDVVPTTVFSQFTNIAGISLTYGNIDAEAQSSPEGTTALFVYEFILG